MTLSTRLHPEQTDRRQTDVRPVREQRLSPMARRVAANKAAQLRTGGDRPMGADESLDSGKAA